MDLQLAGKVALVTGASRGIGLAVARAFAAEALASSRGRVRSPIGRLTPATAPKSMGSDRWRSI